MRILAVDTSSMVTSVAILEDENIIADFSVNQVKTHGEMLMPMIDRVLKSVGLKLGDLDCFAVGIGPGSFTGLRIGVTAVKSLAQVLDKPIIGISTLEALANHVIEGDNVISLIDARGNRVFTGSFKVEDGEITLKDSERLTSVSEVEKIIEENPNSILIGDGAEKIKSPGLELIRAGSHLNNCIARSIAVLAKKKFERQEFDSYFDLLPNYLRKSQAELDLERKNKN